MKKIKSVNIDNSDLSKNKTIRRLSILGDVGAVFSVYVTNEDNHYYNFETKTFTSTAYRLLQKEILDEEGYFIPITFPLVTDPDEYNVYVYAESHFETSFVDSLSTSLIYKVPNFSIETNANGSLKYPSSIYQYLDITTTISLLHSDSDIVEPSNYTFVKPKSTDFKNIGNKLALESPNNTTTLDWTIPINNSDHALTILAQPDESHFYTTTQKIVNGATSSSATVILDDIKGLRVGMEITHKVENVGVEDDTVALSTEAIIRGVNAKAKTLTLSNAQSFENDSTLTIQAYGLQNVKNIYGADIELSDMKYALATVTNNDTGGATDFNVKTQIKTQWSSSTSVDVDSTRGIKAGNTISMTGLDQALTVSSVTDADTFVASGTNATTIPVDTDIYFTGSSDTSSLTGTLTFLKSAHTSFTLTLDLNKIITITDTY